MRAPWRALVACSATFFVQEEGCRLVDSKGRIYQFDRNDWNGSIGGISVDPRVRFRIHFLCGT